MSPIELTDLHKSRLLEMCRVLFPEYNRIEISDYQIDVDRNHYNPIFIDIYKGVLTVPFDIYSTHWFEFCMTKLWIKINSLLSHKTPEELMSMYNAFWDILNEELHPVNYLYEQFKQLKINK